jgi:hypothetical protein
LGVVGLLVLCVIGCGLGYFIGLPRVRDGVQDSMEDAISTTVAEQIPGRGSGTARPGVYEITEAELQGEINGNVDVQNVDSFVIDITSNGMIFRIGTNGDQDLTYSGKPVAENGHLVMSNMESSEGYLDWIFPADDLGEAIENAVNDYLAANNLALESVKLSNGTMTLETVTAPK